MFSFLKRPYIVNYRSMEVHKVDNLKHNCHVELMTDKQKIYSRKANKLLKQGYNGCRWCFPSEDTDMKEG